MDKNYSNLSFDDVSYEVANLKQINLYLTKRIVLNFLKFFLKYSISDIYIKSLVEAYSPKIVISHNMEGYAYRIKYLCNKIYCITYQHSFFYENEKDIYSKNFKDKACDLFISYHPDDTKFLSKLIKSRFIALGSIKNNEIVLEKNINRKIPLLLISEFRRNPSKLHYKKQIELCLYVKEFAKRKNIIPHVALSANRSDKDRYNLLKEELKFFKKYLDDFKWNKEDSFVTANKANLNICLTSNMGIELLSRGYKTIFFNLIGDSDHTQVNPYLIKKKPEYFFIKLSKEEIIAKLNYFFDLKFHDWSKESNYSKNSIPFDERNIYFKKEIKKILKNIKNE